MPGGAAAAQARGRDDPDTAADGTFRRARIAVKSGTVSQVREAAGPPPAGAVRSATLVAAFVGTIALAPTGAWADEPAPDRQSEGETRHEGGERGDARGADNDAGREGARSESMDEGTASEVVHRTRSPRVWRDVSADRLRASAYVGGNYFSRQIQLGHAYPDDQTPGSAPLVGARVGYLLVPAVLEGFAPSPRLHVELETKLTTSSTRGDSDAGRPSYFSPVLGVRALARMDFWPQDELSPFVLAGAGAETFFSRSPWVTSPNTDGVFLWGAGVDYDIHPRAGLRVDLRQGLAPARTRRMTATYEFHAGAFFRFGRAASPVTRRIFTEAPPPSDRDPGSLASAPAKSGDAVADCSEETAGCGEDGERDDSAPHTPVESPDEAPRGNGVTAFEDGEEETAATPPATTDEPGDPDDDPERSGPRGGDGETGADETEAGEAKADEARSEDDVAERLSALAAEIRFEPESAALSPAARDQLDGIASILAAQADLRVEIGGHSQDADTRSVNVMLAQARARRVLSYLVDQGIDEERLRAVGYGPDVPAPDGDARAGADHRIEISPITGDGEG